ncbi:MULTISPECIES: hypothetical protein [Citricoccus]|uniref:Antitoxin ParD1/3/4 n=1 Tax=Citricoccus muralis TaxID=169134 RepID=A0ABY8H639_9MICC|nr:MULTISPECIES: hypothetical protein [Citricoccus]WBL20264.1 hypothetical protein O1A05_06160 [Citricoccus sp. NR2]WFP16143.1 hypothetical protein P8192_12210 [Citricoccus muralis]
MESNLPEVLNAARSLTRAERAAVAQELISELTNHEYEDLRSADLRAVLEQGLTKLESGQGIQAAVDHVDDHLNQAGRSAAESASE